MYVCVYVGMYVIVNMCYVYVSVCMCVLFVYVSILCKSRVQIILYISEPLYHVLEQRDTSSNENGSVSLDQTRQMVETNNELRRSSGIYTYI